MIRWVSWESSIRPRASGNGMQGSRSGHDIVVVVVHFRGHREERLDGWIDAFAPEGEAPVGEGAVVGVDFGVFYQDAPGADARFAPGVGVSLRDSV